MIRPIQPTDQADYLQMSRDFYRSEAVLHDIPQANRERTFQQLTEGTPYAACFMFEQEAQTVGYGLLALTWSQEAGGLTVWIEELYVKPAFRGRGLGRAFFAALPALYPNAARFRLEIEPDNFNAARLYRTMGYNFLNYRQMFLDSPLQNT